MAENVFLAHDYERNELKLANEVLRSQRNALSAEKGRLMVYVEASRQELGYMLIQNEKIKAYTFGQL